MQGGDGGWGKGCPIPWLAHEVLAPASFTTGPILQTCPAHHSIRGPTLNLGAGQAAAAGGGGGGWDSDGYGGSGSSGQPRPDRS